MENNVQGIQPININTRPAQSLINQLKSHRQAYLNDLKNNPQNHINDGGIIGKLAKKNAMNNIVYNNDPYQLTSFSQQMQEKQWAREDAIRKETQEREDTAWQRAITDIEKAGGNPNLILNGPAASGGGISNATGMNMTEYESQFNAAKELILQEIDQNFQGNEKDKDRFTSWLNALTPKGIFKIG